MHISVHSSIIYNCQDMENCPSTEEWIKKMWLNIFNRILIIHKKEQNFCHLQQHDGLGGHYTKWNKSEKDKYCMISLIYEILKLKQTSEYIKKKKKKQTQQREQTSGYQFGSNIRWGSGRYKLLGTRYAEEYIVYPILLGLPSASALSTCLMHTTWLVVCFTLDSILVSMLFSGGRWEAGIGMGNTCKSMADSCQCMAKPTTIL